MIVHLAVADGGVSEGVRGQHAAQRGDPRLVLEGWMLRQRAVQVALDLLCGGAGFSSAFLQQIRVVAGMSCQRGARV